MDFIEVNNDISVNIADAITLVAEMAALLRKDRGERRTVKK